MRLSMKPFIPNNGPSPGNSHITTKQRHCSCSVSQQVSFNTHTYLLHPPTPKNWESFLIGPIGPEAARIGPPMKKRLGKRWMEYQGVNDWAGLLDPLDDTLRAEILRYGYFVEAAYGAFEFDPSSISYGSCKYPKRTLLEESGFRTTGYRLTQNLRATSGIQLPSWAGVARSSWAATQSSWIGYVAVCHDRKEIRRLGRRDVVIAFRGTATCLEWLENLQANLAPITLENNINADARRSNQCEPMVETGFLSLYTSRTATSPSLQDTLRREIRRILQLYPDEPLSFTITGHSLGAALATLAAYDIKTTFKRAPLVTVISFGGPRVGNRSFRSLIEKQGTKILRVVNPNDLITKVPGFVIDDEKDIVDNWDEEMKPMAGFWPGWIQKRVEGTQWMYAEVGCELRLTTKVPERRPYYLSNMNLAKCHDLKTYLKLVEGLSSNCPIKATARRLMNKQHQNDQTSVGVV